jgi:RNA polymerase sigma-70 factor (sigma-E family)
MHADVAPLWVQDPALREIGTDVGGQVAAADGRPDGAGAPDGVAGDGAAVAATAGAFGVGVGVGSGVGSVGARGHGAVPGRAVTGRAGDRSFDDFYRAHYESLVRLAYLLTPSEDVARDLVQDVFVRVYGRFAALEEPLPYLRRCVVNASRSWHRRRQLEWSRSRTADPVSDVAFEADELFDVLARLPSRQRAAIVLRFYEQMSDNEIAALLHCRPGTVASLVHRGCVRLRGVMAEPGEER